MQRGLAIGFGVLLLGCDTIHGVSRTAVLDTFPSMECVRTAIGATPGITSIEYQEIDGGTALTLGGLQPAGKIHTFRYRGPEGSHIIGVLQVHQDHLGTVSFTQSIFDINRVPPQEDIDASRPVMLALEHRLADMCAIRELPARVTETCQDVQCQPLQQGL